MAPLQASAIEIAVANYGASPGSFPFAVAMGKRYFQEFGVDVTAIRTAPGAAPAIRQMLAGDLPFAEAGVTGAIGAIRGGADLRIISTDVNTISDVNWVTMPNSLIKSIADLKGKKIGFTSPKSATNMMAVLLVKKAGLKPGDVQLIAAGSFTQALTALETGGVDIVPMVEPNASQSGQKYRLVAKGSETFPPMSNTVGLATAKAIKEQPEVLRGILAARRKAVEFMLANPAEASQIIGPTFKLEPALVEKIIVELKDHGAVDGVPYWGLGDIKIKLLENILEGALLTGEITEAYDFRPLIDERFLPDDLKTKKQ